MAVARYETDRVIVSEGLAKGDIVVTAGVNRLRERPEGAPGRGSLRNERLQPFRLGAAPQELRRLPDAGLRPSPASGPTASSAARKIRPSPSRPWWSRRCGPAPPPPTPCEQVTDRIEKKLEELPYLDFVRSYTKPGESVVFVNLKDRCAPPTVPDLWYQVRKKIDDIRHTLPSGIAGPVLQ